MTTMNISLPDEMKAFGESFKTGRDIHAVTQNVIAIHYDVALVNPDPKFDAIIAKGRSTTQEAQRLSTYKEATERMCDESPAAPASCIHRETPRARHARA